MRLTNHEKKSIIQTFKDIFQDGKIYLFGSRVYDDQKGGDIDLYIITNDDNKIEKKSRFITILQDKIGDQKIDIVFNKDNLRDIEKIALKEGIMLNNINLKIKTYLDECSKHIKRIDSSSKKMSNFMPLDSKKYLELGDDEVVYIDQFLFRFSKLQDTIGRNLFKAILIFQNGDDEYIESLTFIDILNKLEKLKIINSANEWKRLRDDRNKLSHTYDDEPDEVSEAINLLYIKKDILIKIFSNIKNYFETHNSQ